MSTAPARALGRLVSDIESGARNDQISESLATAVRRLRPRALDVELTTDGTLLDGKLIDATSSPETELLVAAMRRHGLSGITFAIGVTPRELLQFAAMLAVSDTSSSQPTVFEASRRLGFWNIALRGDGAITFSSTPTSQPVPEPLPLSNLEAATTQATELMTALDQAVHEQQALQTATALSRAVRTEAAALERAKENGDPEHTAIAVRWSECVESMSTVASLRLVAGLLGTDAFPHAESLAILKRAGDAGTSALMQYLTAAPTLVQRRVYFDAIVSIRTGVPVLIAHLKHEHWFVVRNAACLLGAMAATEAESALIAELDHPRERVRTAIATALGQLGTPTSRRALEGAIRDSSTDVRRQALSVLLHPDGLARSATLLSEALDLEHDEDVQLEVINALRTLGTPHAVQQLVRLCSPTGSARKTPGFRRAAIEALAELRPTAAAPLLRIATQDRDPETRLHAKELLAQLTRTA